MDTKIIVDNRKSLDDLDFVDIEFDSYNNILRNDNNFCTSLNILINDFNNKNIHPQNINEIIKLAYILEYSDGDVEKIVIEKSTPTREIYKLNNCYKQVLYLPKFMTSTKKDIVEIASCGLVNWLPLADFENYKGNVLVKKICSEGSIECLEWAYKNGYKNEFDQKNFELVIDNLKIDFIKFMLDNFDHFIIDNKIFIQSIHSYRCSKFCFDKIIEIECIKYLYEKLSTEEKIISIKGIRKFSKKIINDNDLILLQFLVDINFRFPKGDFNIILKKANLGEDHIDALKIIIRNFDKQIFDIKYIFITCVENNYIEILKIFNITLKSFQNLITFCSVDDEKSKECFEYLVGIGCDLDSVFDIVFKSNRYFSAYIYIRKKTKKIPNKSFYNNCLKEGCYDILRNLNKNIFKIYDFDDNFVKSLDRINNYYSKLKRACIEKDNEYNELVTKKQKLLDNLDKV